MYWGNGNQVSTKRFLRFAPGITHLLPAPVINETAIFNKGNHVSITSSRRVKAAK